MTSRKASRKDSKFSQDCLYQNGQRLDSCVLIESEGVSVLMEAQGPEQRLLSHAGSTGRCNTSYRLLGQHFSQGPDLSGLYSINPKQDSVFRLY